MAMTPENRHLQILTLLLCLAVLLFFPESVSACLSCTQAQYFDAFPFLQIWQYIAVVWICIHFFGKPATNLESIIVLAIFFFTGIAIILFYWAFMVARELWSAWKMEKNDRCRRETFQLNGITAALMLLAFLPLPGQDTPQKLVERLKPHPMYQTTLNKKIVAKGEVMTPLLGKVLLEGIADPACVEDKGSSAPEQCGRARNAALLLGSIGGKQAMELLATAAASKAASIAGTANDELKQLAEKNLARKEDSAKDGLQKTPGKDVPKTSTAMAKHENFWTGIAPYLVVAVIIIAILSYISRERDEADCDVPELARFWKAMPVFGGVAGTALGFLVTKMALKGIGADNLFAFVCIPFVSCLVGITAGKVAEEVRAFQVYGGARKRLILTSIILLFFSGLLIWAWRVLVNGL
jgi:hypothetical protein